MTQFCSKLHDLPATRQWLLQVWADQVGDDSYTFDNMLQYYEKSVAFTPPDTEKRFP